MGKAKPKRTWVEIDPNALRTNLYYAREQAEGADVMAVVKADAYGHGFAETIKALDSEVIAFGVATLNEALAVMSVTKKTTDIMILGALLPDEREDAVSTGLHVTISSLVEAKQTSEQKSPELIIADIEYGQSELDVKIARSDLSPTAKLSLERTYVDDLSATYDEREKDVLQATVSWPFQFGGKNRSNVNKNLQVKGMKKLLLENALDLYAISKK